MLKAEAQSSIKKINSEIVSLTPSALINLFELDLTDLIFSQNLQGLSDINKKSIFYFHNNVKLFQSSIWFKGKEYIAAPIQAEGFEINSKGTLPTPKISITTIEEGIPTLSNFKSILADLGDIVGAKLTRVRTFAKYLDLRNFYTIDILGNQTPIDENSIPEGFSPDSKAEFPPDIFYVDRKSSENKFHIEFELASLLDIEGIKLPGRLVVANRCPWCYRGIGCIYEYGNALPGRISEEHEYAVLPSQAPPVANDKNEKIETLIGQAIIVKGEFNPNASYSKGNAVFVKKDGVKYYFVAKVNSPSQPPPNTNYWIADQCSKTLTGCKLRWGTEGVVRPVSLRGKLPYGGFAAANKIGGQ